MLRTALRRYGLIENYKTRIIDNFEEHYQWMNTHKPDLAVLYFKNDWNPECSRKLMKDYIEMFKHEGFQTFAVETWTREGERTKKYYSVRYEPTFLFLSDGFEIKKMIGGCAKDLKQQLEKVKLFRRNLMTEYGIDSTNIPWENYHDEHMKKWEDFNKQEAYNHEGTIMFERH